MDIKTNTRFHSYSNDFHPEFTYSGFVKTDASWKQKPLYAPYSRLYFVESGSGVLYSKKQKMLLEAGNVYLSPCGTECGFYGTPSVTKLFFHFNLFYKTKGNDIFENFENFAKIKYSINDIAILKNAYMNCDENSSFMLNAELYSVISKFLKLKNDMQASVAEHSEPIVNAIKYIRYNLNAKLRVREISEAALCSQSKLHLLFIKEIGKSVSQYVEDLILSEAQTMLLYTDLSIAQISEQLGFYDQFYFSRRFKIRFGVSPRLYRNKI